MRLKFVKMSGAGNDFIVLDNRDSSLDQLISTEFVRNLCLRGLSIGADGLLELRADSEYPFRMKYYNSDGKAAEMCGNGGRCIAGYAASIGLVPAEGSFMFRSDAGVHAARIEGADTVRLWMTDPEVFFLDRNLSLDGYSLQLSFVDTGVPHTVLFADEYQFDHFQDIAPKLREHIIFGEAGTNVDFVLITDGSKPDLRTWERGVEGETLACGTGAVAAALCASEILSMELPIEFQVSSGRSLTVGKNGIGWWLKGEARAVYTGELESTHFNSLTKDI
jgi:diaminopimelate epimerase